MDFSKELFEQQGHGELVFSQQLLLQQGHRLYSYYFCRQLTSVSWCAIFVF